MLMAIHYQSSQQARKNKFLQRKPTILSIGSNQMSRQKIEAKKKAKQKQNKTKDQKKNSKPKINRKLTAKTKRVT